MLGVESLLPLGEGKDEGVNQRYSLTLPSPGGRGEILGVGKVLERLRKRCYNLLRIIEELLSMKELKE